LKKGYTVVQVDVKQLATATYLFRITLPDKEHKQKVFVK